MSQICGESYFIPTRQCTPLYTLLQLRGELELLSSSKCQSECWRKTGVGITWSQSYSIRARIFSLSITPALVSMLSGRPWHWAPLQLLWTVPQQSCRAHQQLSRPTSNMITHSTSRQATTPLYLNTTQAKWQIDSNLNSFEAGVQGTKFEWYCVSPNSLGFKLHVCYTYLQHSFLSVFPVSSKSHWMLRW